MGDYLDSIHNVNVSPDTAYKYMHRNDTSNKETMKYNHKNDEPYAIWKKVESKGCYWYACSYCGHDVPRNKFNQDWFADWCPNCGRRTYMEN